MKKLFCILLATLMLVGCNQTSAPDNTTSDTSNHNTDAAPQKFEYVISPNSNSLRDYINTDIDDNEDYTLRYTTEKRKFSDLGGFSELEYKLEDAEPIVQFEFNGKAYEFKLYQSYDNEYKVSKNEALQSLGWIDKYNSYAGEENNGLSGSLLLLHETGEAIGFSDYEAWTDTTDGDLTVEEARELAEEDIASFLGEEDASQYTFQSSKVTRNSDEKTIYLEYARYICGYPTFDTIEITYNLIGQLCNISASQYGVFDAAVSEITLEKITKAERVFTDALSHVCTIESKRLVMDIHGKCYIEFEVGYPEGTLLSDKPREIIINID